MSTREGITRSFVDVLRDPDFDKSLLNLDFDFSDGLPYGAEA